MSIQDDSADKSFNEPDKLGAGGRVLIVKPIFPTSSTTTLPHSDISGQPPVNRTASYPGFGVCLPRFPTCDPLGCSDPTTAPIDCPDTCSRGAVGGTIFGMLIFALFIITGNLLVIRIIVRTPSLRRRHDYIKLSMAFADLLVGLVVVPAAIVNLIISLYNPRGEDVTSHQLVTSLYQHNTNPSIIFGTLAVISVMCSLYNLLLLSIDRFLAIARPLKNRADKYFSRSNLLMSVGIVWLFGLVLSIIPACFPKHFAYEMDLTTFFFVQIISGEVEGSTGFAPYYVAVIVGGPYVATVLLNILTTVFTWKRLKIRARLSSRRPATSTAMMDRSAVEKKCERNRRLQMLQKAYPEAMEDMPSSSSTFTTFFKKGTPRHDLPNKDKRQRGGASSGSHKRDNWFARWHGNDNASNNVSTDSDRSNNQSPRFQRTRDNLHIVRDVLNPTQIKNRAREYKESHRTHLRVLRMIVAMIVSFTVCLLPYIVVTLQISNNSLSCVTYPASHIFAMYMLFLNSGMNFVIYNIWHPEFRRHLKKTFISDYSRTSSFRRAASSFFVTSQKAGETSSSYMPRTSNSVDDVLREQADPLK